MDNCSKMKQLFYNHYIYNCDKLGWDEKHLWKHKLNCHILVHVQYSKMRTKVFLLANNYSNNYFFFIMATGLELLVQAIKKCEGLALAHWSLLHFLFCLVKLHTYMYTVVTVVYRMSYTQNFNNRIPTEWK